MPFLSTEKNMLPQADPTAAMADGAEILSSKRSVTFPPWQTFAIKENMRQKTGKTAVLPVAREKVPLIL